MNRTSLAALLGLALATAPAVRAKGEGLSYTYVEGRDWVFYDRNAIVELGARWHIDGMWSVGLDTALTRDERNVVLGLRAQW